MGKFSSQNSNDNIKAKDMSPKFKLPSFLELYNSKVSAWTATVSHLLIIHPVNFSNKQKKESTIFAFQAENEIQSYLKLEAYLKLPMQPVATAYESCIPRLLRLGNTSIPLPSSFSLFFFFLESGELYSASLFSLRPLQLLLLFLPFFHFLFDRHPDGKHELFVLH